MKPSFIEFCKRVGIVSGAIAGVLVLVNLTAGFAWTVATRPIMDAIAAETQVRIAADLELTRRLETISRDRLDLIDVMSTPFGPARDRKLVEVRARWAR